MTRKVRLFLYGFIFLSIGVLILAVVSGLKEGGEGGLTVESLPEATIEDVSYSGSSDGVRLYDLSAKSATHMSGSEKLLLKDVTVRHYTDNRLSATLTGREAIYSESSGLVEVKGDVKVVSSEGYVLYSDLLIYHMDSGLLSTDTPIRLVSNDMVLTGVGLKVDTRLGVMEVLSNVEYVMNVKGR